MNQEVVDSTNLVSPASRCVEFRGVRKGEYVNFRSSDQLGSIQPNSLPLGGLEWASPMGFLFVVALSPKTFQSFEYFYFKRVVLWGVQAGFFDLFRKKILLDEVLFVRMGVFVIFAVA